MAPLTFEGFRRQEDPSVTSTPPPAVESSIPGSAESPTPSSQGSTPLKLPIPAIAGIVTVGLIMVGLVVLLWRWRVRMKEMRRISMTLRGSYGKYGLGAGISSENSVQKTEIPGSFFEADDLVDRSRRKSSLTFMVAAKPPPTRRASKRGFVSQRRASLNSRKASSSTLAGSYQPKVDEKRPVKVQHYPDVRAKGISAPLHVANGEAEPWSPVTASPATASSMSSRIPLRPPKLTSPPPVAFPQAMKEIGMSPTISDRQYASGSEPGRRTISLFSSDGSLYSRNSLSSDNIGSPTAPNSIPAYFKTSGVTHARKPSTPPLPPSTATLTHPSLYGYESDSSRRPGTADHPNLPRLMTVITRYVPTMDDELLLQVGDSVRVIEEYKDGWCMVQQVGRIDSPRGVVPAVCLQERRRIVPVPMSVAGSLSMKKSDASLASQRR